MEQLHMPDVQRWIAAVPTSMVLQPTTWCPAACTYCYLPGRHRNNRMEPTTAAAIAHALPEPWLQAGPLELIWHGGEPLAVGPERLAQLLDPFESLRQAGQVRHKIQTSATLLTDAWCDLFQHYDIGVGISIDGPRDHNTHRLDRHGRPLFDRTLAGTEILRRHGIEFTALAVITPDTASAATEILDFIAGLGCTWIGLNIEALEAANARTGRTLALEQAQRFWRDAFTWALHYPDVHLRDLERLLTFLGLEDRNRDTRHDLIPTIGWNGDVVVLSPELLGVDAPEHRDFVVGNVTNTPLLEILSAALTARYVQDYATGISRCQSSCDFFAYCQGAHAGNRYFEHASFTATETAHCRASYQAPVLALADLNHVRSVT